MFRDTSANGMSKAMLISQLEQHILPKVSKTVGLQKRLKMYFEQKLYAREVNLPILEKSTGLKLVTKITIILYRERALKP
jgi:hypothetical protein